jgi:hypothetical protein
MTVEHALSFKTGGLVHIWYNDVADEWRHLCGTALSPCQVERKPRIFSSVSRRVRNAAGASAPDSSTPTGPQTLHVHLPPLRNGGMPAAMDSGNVAERPYLICVLQTWTLDPTGGRNLQKFWNSMIRRRRISISRTVWKCDINSNHSSSITGNCNSLNLITAQNF